MLYIYLMEKIKLYFNLSKRIRFSKKLEKNIFILFLGFQHQDSKISSIQKESQLINMFQEIQK